MDNTEDIYRLPPMEIRSFEEWSEQNEKEEQTASLDIPEPDYSDDEDENNNTTKDEVKEEENEEEEEDKHDKEGEKKEEEEECKEEQDEDFSQLNHEQKAKFLERKLRLLSHEEVENSTSELDSLVEIPDPDYHEEENGDEGKKVTPKFKHTVLGRKTSNPSSAGPIINADGLVEPRKLANPVLESREHQDLHRELYMNRKMGIDVLHKKPEFQKEIQRRRTQKDKKEEEEKKITFEKKLEEQAHKLRSVNPPQKSPPVVVPINEENEFLRIHSKISRSQSSS